MVYYSEQADRDLDNILNGLLYWQKIQLSFDFCYQYVVDIVDVSNSLDKKTFHFNTVYEDHCKYGSSVHSYKRNNNTTWYIIYDTDKFGNAYINKITNNYLTQQ
jgi:capsid portal protein